MPDPQDQNIELIAEDIFRDLAIEATIRPIGNHLLVHEFPKGALVHFHQFYKAFDSQRFLQN